MKIVAYLFRLVRFVAGFALIGFAQHVLYQTGNPLIQFDFSDAFNARYRIDVPNFDNVIAGSVLVVIGGLVAASALVLRTTHSPKPSIVPPLDNANNAPSENEPASPTTDPPISPVLPAISTKGNAFFRFLRNNLVLIVLALAAGALFGILIQQVELVNPSASLFVIWLVILVIVGFIAFRIDKRAKTSLATKTTRRDVLIIAGLLVLGLVINTHDLATVPNSIVGDEGSFWERARGIAQGQETLSVFDQGVYTFPLMSSMYQGAILSIFGVTFWSWRFSSVSIAVLAVIPTYLLALELFNRRIAILSSIAMVALPYFIAFARIGYISSQSMLPVVLCFYLLYLGVKRNSVFYYVAAGIMAGLGYYTFNAGELGVAVGIVFVLYAVVSVVIKAVRQKPRPARWLIVRETGRAAILGVAFVSVAVLTIAPGYIYDDLANPTLASEKNLESLFPNALYAGDLFSLKELTRDYPLTTIGTQQYFYRPDLYAVLLVRGVIRSLLPYQMAPGVISSHYLAAPLPGPLGVPFCLVGMFLLFRRLFRRENFLLELWFFGAIFLLSAIHTFPPRYTHTIPVIPVMAIFIAVGIVATVDAVLDLIRLNRGILPHLIVGTIVLALIATDLYNYFVEMPPLYPPDADNLMAFTAMQLTHPVNMVYVTSDPNRNEQYVPYLIIQVPNKANFMTVKPDALENNTFAVTPNTDYMFFADQASEAAVVHYVAQHFTGNLTPDDTTVQNQQQMFQWTIPAAQNPWWSWETTF